MSDTAALCGDPTCEGPGCQASSIDAWEARQEADVKALFSPGQEAGR